MLQLKQSTLTHKPNSIKPKQHLVSHKPNYKLKENKIAIELNGTIVPKNNYRKKKIKNNDKIEIVQFIGGG